VPDQWHHHAAKLKKWRETFASECVLAGFYDDLEAGAQKYLDPICDFSAIVRFLVPRLLLGANPVHRPRRPAPSG
jgi:hypothetical protein